MSAPDLSSATMEKFRDSGLSESLTLLLGAGASTTSGLPDWDTFGCRLLTQSGAVTDENIARLLISHQDPMLVIEGARSAASPDRWERLLRTALYEGIEAEQPSALHLAAVSHLLDPDAPQTELATLNFDVLLEKAIEQETGHQATSSTTGEVAGDLSYTVHHLHGVIRHENAERVVLTLSEFSDLIADRSAWQAQYIHNAIQRGALLIAGTSYRDPDLRHWLHSALRDKPSGRQAIVLLARQGFAMTKSEFSLAETALAGQWRAIGLQPVLLEDHSDAAQIIRELPHTHAADYISPQQRAKAVWTAHLTQFDQLQARYVDLLSADAESLRRELDVPALNVSLWIADGAGRLARWAAHDRIYREAEALRTVETGHDSRWIAGQALAGESLLHQNLGASDTRRWQSVLALPLAIAHPRFPRQFSAVLTIGLPEPAERLEKSASIWGGPLGTIGDAWSERLSYIGFEGQWSGVMWTPR